MKGGLGSREVGEGGAGTNKEGERVKISREQPISMQRYRPGKAPLLTNSRRMQKKKGVGGTLLGNQKPTIYPGRTSLLKTKLERFWAGEGIQRGNAGSTSTSSSRDRSEEASRSNIR